MLRCEEVVLATHTREIMPDTTERQLARTGKPDAPRRRADGSAWSTCRWAMLAAACAFGACADEALPELDTPSDTVETAEARQGLLAAVELDYGTVRFHRFDTPDGYTRIVVSEELHGFHRNTPFSQLAGASATHLEMLLALAPDAEPHPLIRALHADEARSLGRTSDAVRTLQVDRTLRIEKSPESCQAWVFEDPPDNCGVRTWTNGRQANFVSGDAALHVGQNWSYATTKPVTLGICNESSVPVSGRIGIDYGNDTSSTYAFLSWATVAPGSAWRWYDFTDTRACPQRCTGDVCGLSAGCQSPSRYRVDGRSPQGSPYHLYTAEAHQPNCWTL